MTLIIGWICADGIILAADNEGVVRTEGLFPQRQIGAKKIKQIGRNCAVGVIGHATAAWKTVSDVADDKAGSEVDAGEMSKTLASLANDNHAQESDLSFLVGGYKETATGKRKVLYEVRKSAGTESPFVIDEATNGIRYSGVTYACQFLEQYLGIPAVLTRKQAKRIAAIFIAATSRDAAYGVGDLGSIAEIADDNMECSMIDDEDTLKSLREIAVVTMSGWREVLRRVLTEDNHAINSA